LSKLAPPDLIPIGKIVKPHGIGGELKFRLYNNSSELLGNSKAVWLEFLDKRIQQILIESVVLKNEGSRIKFKDVDDREMAETYRDATISVPRGEFPETAEDELYLVDLIGYTVIDQNGLNIGTITDIVEFPASDMMLVNNKNNEHMIPLLDEFVTLFDFDKKQVTIQVIDGLLDS
jgi:16S rRNA processing protein RimM